jgi:succinate dehydrogenase / fumarate reductase cytochrome b subunit
MHTLGWNNDIWLKRWETIGRWYVTLVILGFASVVVVFFAQSL